MDNPIAAFFLAIIPKFWLIFRGDVGALINTLVCTGVLLVMWWALWQIRRQRKSALEAVKALDAVVRMEGATRASRNELARRTSNADALHTWREFDETLVYEPATGREWSTVDADYFFNSRSLAAGLSHNSRLSFMPSTLTAIGVLGTFIGLAYGLGGLDFSADTELDNLKASINQLVSGAAAAFVTSIWGVAASLVVGYAHKRSEAKVDGKIHDLQFAVDAVYTRFTGEQASFDISRNTGLTVAAFDDLHEKIGQRFQEAVEGLSKDMQEALVEAIDRSLAPSMDKLTDTTSKQSSELLQGLIEKFGNTFVEHGERQAVALGGASAKIDESLSAMSQQFVTLMDRVEAQTLKNHELTSQALQELRTSSASSLHEMQSSSTAAVADMQQTSTAALERFQAAAGDRITALVETTSEFQEETSKRFAEMNTLVADQNQHFQQEIQGLVALSTAQRQAMEKSVLELAQLSEKTQVAITEVSGLLAKSTSDLQVAAGRFGTSAEAIQTQATRAATQLAEAATSQKDLASRFTTQLSHLDRLTEATAKTAGNLDASAEKAGRSFTELRAHQEEFLGSLGKEFSNVTANLRDELDTVSLKLTENVESMSKTMSSWLTEYAEKVSDHTEDRMNEWNEHSRTYAGHMATTAQTLAQLLDEIEESRNAQRA